jgi:hypothetical protein
VRERESEEEERKDGSIFGATAKIAGSVQQRSVVVVVVFKRRLQWCKLDRIDAVRDRGDDRGGVHETNPTSGKRAERCALADIRGERGEAFVRDDVD